MKITYDASANAAYIYLVDDIRPGGVAVTKPIDENINLDFNAAGQLVGIEVLNASKNLPANVLGEK
jgi:uncharacterized protein YuzE